MAESQEDLKSLLIRVKEENAKADWKVSIQKPKRSWHLVPGLHGKWKGKRRKADRFYFLGLQSHCGCIHEIKRHLLLGRKAMTNIGSVLKTRDITLLTKVHIAKVKVFPVVMYQCERWTLKKCQRIDALKLWCRKGSWESLGLQGDQASPS